MIHRVQSSIPVVHVSGSLQRTARIPRSPGAGRVCEVHTVPQWPQPGQKIPEMRTEYLTLLFDNVHVFRVAVKPAKASCRAAYCAEAAKLRSCSSGGGFAPRPACVEPGVGSPRSNWRTCQLRRLESKFPPIKTFCVLSEYSVITLILVHPIRIVA